MVTVKTLFKNYVHFKNTINYIINAVGLDSNDYEALVNAYSSLWWTKNEEYGRVIVELNNMLNEIHNDN